MTERKITVKGFVKKASAAKSATAFLSQYREYLTTGEVATITSPILDKIDNGDLVPTAGLNEITNAVFAHMMVMNIRKAEASIEAANEPAVTKPVVARIVDSRGEELHIDSFHLGQDAERWVDNRLYAGTPGSHGEVIHTKIILKGKPATTIITREDSIARILKKPRGAATKRMSASSGRLGFGVKVRNSHASFSRG